MIREIGLLLKAKNIAREFRCLVIENVSLKFLPFSLLLFLGTLLFRDWILSLPLFLTEKIKTDTVKNHIVYNSAF